MVPVLTEEERRQNLDKAMRIRKERSEIRASLKAKRMSIEEFFELADNGNEAARGMRVEALIRSMPNYALPRTQQLMKRLRISSSRRVKGLGKHQRNGLVEALGGKKHEA